MFAAKIKKYLTAPGVPIRVTVLIPFCFLLTYLFLRPGPPLKILDWMTGVYFTGTVLWWILFSGALSGKILIRFAIAGIWGNLMYLVLFNSASGGSLYFRIIAFLGFSGLVLFAITGKGYKELLEKQPGDDGVGEDPFIQKTGEVIGTIAKSFKPAAEAIKKQRNDKLIAIGVFGFCAFVAVAVAVIALTKSAQASWIAEGTDAYVKIRAISLWKGFGSLALMICVPFGLSRIRTDNHVVSRSIGFSLRITFIIAGFLMVIEFWPALSVVTEAVAEIIQIMWAM